jgi:phosphate-selective porin OprO/OprP
MKRIFIILFFALLYITGNAQVNIIDGLEIKAGGDVQVDSRNYIDNTVTPNNNFLIRRARLDLRGTYLGIFEFRLLPNFAPGSVEIDDAYAQINFFPALKLRGGRFKTPIGLERLQSPTNSLFIEGGLTNNLIPNRDIGFELSGSIAGSIINYSAGVYNSTVDGRNADNDEDNSKEFSGRLFLQPFNQEKESLLNKLGFGIAFSTGNQKGTVASTRLSTYRTSTLNPFFRFRDSVYASGTRTRIVPQLYYYAGRLGFLGEYVLNKQHITRNSSSADISNNSWQATISFLLTDDNASYNGVKPKNNFDSEKGYWGAFEIAFRFNSLTTDDALFPVFSNPGNSAQKANAWTVALNWYLNPVIRISVNYDNTTFEKYGAGAALPDEKILLTRLQAAF